MLLNCCNLFFDWFCKHIHSFDEMYVFFHCSESSSLWRKKSVFACTCVWRDVLCQVPNSKVYARIVGFCLFFFFSRKQWQDKMKNQRPKHGCHYGRTFYVLTLKTRLIVESSPCIFMRMQKMEWAKERKGWKIINLAAVWVNRFF